jgi:RsiW-degrading membrane proteinase PrsW (M82 family)
MTDQNTQQKVQQQQYCCVTGDPVYPPYNIAGGRVYSDKAFKVLNRSNPSFWRATVVQIVGMAIFAVIVAFLSNLINEPSLAVRIMLGVFLAIVPSVLWLLYFYRQDRLEPEPKTYIGLVFFAAFVLTDVLGRRMIYDWFRVPEWASYDTLTSLGASIFINGIIAQLVAYIAIRLVYRSAEFDERMDGIVYGTVAGLGVAAMLNLRYIIDNQGVELAPGVVRTVTTALASASFSGLLGWFMAEAKFEHKPTWWVPAGFAISSILNGMFSWLIGEVAAAGLSVEPWRSLLFGFVVALGTFLVLALLMRRSTAITLRRSASIS